MQTTIVFALFCEAFIGGVSSAHGEILCKKSANNFICPTFCRQNWLYSYECRNILVKKFQISHIYVLSCYIGYTYYGKKKPPHHCEGFLRYGNKMLGNVALRHQGTGLKQLRGIDFTSRAAPRSQKNEASDRLQPH